MDPAPVIIPPDASPFLLVQYDTEGQPEHWALALLELIPPSLSVIPSTPFTRTIVHIYQVRKLSDTFAFDYQNIPYIEFARDPALRGGCLIGFVPAPAYSNITWLKNNIRHCVPVQEKSDWNDQHWVLDCIQWLKDEKPKWIEIGVTEETIREELAMELQRWEDVVDVVYERLMFLQ
ncbi:hypothetical protein D9758_004399 [Tetrapyrgos nigripes]|uniref:Uncharacterized protein n=1 Tax=Tetrapyrgos nigripes TaxID=182062 RepID=A0A8H5GMX2_9AGAR|nr:hypothetical protein D9758_004399 [Tetrapyrgos nigripes]